MGLFLSLKALSQVPIVPISEGTDGFPAEWKTWYDQWPLYAVKIPNFGINIEEATTMESKEKKGNYLEEGSKADHDLKYYYRSRLARSTWPH